MDIKITSERQIKTNNGVENISNSILNLLTPTNKIKINLEAWVSESAENTGNKLDHEQVPNIFISVDTYKKLLLYELYKQLEDEPFNYNVDLPMIENEPWPTDPLYDGRNIRFFLFFQELCEIAYASPELITKIKNDSVPIIKNGNGWWFYVLALTPEDQATIEQYGRNVMNKPV